MWNSDKYTGLKILSSLSLLAVLVFYSCTDTITIIKARDFGAIPGDGRDDTPFIQAAMEACRAHKRSKLVFEPGTYDIHGSKKDDRGNYKPAIEVTEVDNLTLDGRGSEFTGHDNATLMAFTACRNLNISDLSVDWDPLPFTQGKVIVSDTDYLDIEVLPPFVAKSGLRTEAILGYEPDKSRMARRFTDHYQLGFEKTTEVIGQGIMRLFIGRSDRFAGRMPSVGQYVIVRHQVYGYQSFEFVKCSEILVHNVNIYSNPGMGITGDECRNISLDHLRVMIRPGSGRWMSCTADATHFAGCRGMLAMENCFFEGMGDDATNVRSGHYLLVAGRPGNKMLILKTGYRYGDDLTPPEPGDILELSSKEKLLLPYARVTVSSVKLNVQDKALEIRVREELPEQTVAGDVAGDASSCPVLRIRNCTTIRNRSRGFIIKTRDVVIEDCTFEDITECAIALESDINAWWESISASNVIIRNNRFINSKFERGYLHGVIESHTMSQVAPAGVYRQITIADNIFLGSESDIIKIGSADGVNITGNIMDHPEDEAIMLYNSRNVFISGNKLTNCVTALTIGAGCDSATIKCENNTGF